MPDRYVWISAYIGLAQVETAAREDPSLVGPAAARLYEHAVRRDLPEFLAWALVYQAESGNHARAPLARSAAVLETRRASPPGPPSPPQATAEAGLVALPPTAARLGIPRAVADRVRASHEEHLGTLAEAAGTKLPTCARRTRIPHCRR